MAEVVQSHIEEMLPEVYELKQLGILSPGEAKSVIKMRTDFEYKMRRRISKKSDFLRFIDYELKLEKLKEARILKCGINDVSEGARYRSLQRIHFIFQKCLRKHKNDVQLWTRYILYCKQVNSSRSLGLAFVEALKHNPQCVSIWIMSAKNEMETNKNISAARSIFLQGLKFNNNSPKLWTEYFRLEVLHVEKLQKRRLLLQGCDKPENELNSDFLAYKTAKIVFVNALKNISMSDEVMTGFVDVIKNLESAQPLVRFLHETALKKYPENTSLWIGLANYVINKEASKSISILKTAFKLMGSLECLLAIVQFIVMNKNKFEDFKSLIVEFVGTGSNAKIHDPESVKALGDVLLVQSVTGAFSTVLDNAVKKYPTNKMLRLYKIQHFCEDPLKEIEVALCALPEDTRLWSEYLTQLGFVDISNCKQKWDEVIKMKFAAPLVTEYIEFIYSYCGIADARKAFHTVQNWHSISETAITEMLNYEIAQPNNVSDVCNMYNFLTSQFNTLMNWESYISFCKQQCPEKMSSVLWKCRKYFPEIQQFGASL